MVKGLVVQAHTDDIPFLARRLRKADVEEIHDLTGWNPETALWKSFRESKWVNTGAIDGVPVCMFGVTPVTVLGNVGMPWMLGTDGLTENPKVFLRFARVWSERMERDFKVLRNVVSSNNAFSIRFLKWLGFEFSQPVKMGPFGREFLVFEKRSQ